MRIQSLLFVAVASSANAQYFAEILPTPAGTGRAVAAGGGQVVGVTFGAGGGPTLWDGPSHNLISLASPGYSGIEVNGVGGGKQVGYGVSNTTRALMWSGSSGSVIDLHPSSFLGSLAYGTDGKTQVGSASPNGFNSHAVLWQGTAQSAVSLHPAGYQNSEAYDVWGDVQVGSIADGPTAGGAVLWRGTAATMQILPTPAGFIGAGAVGIHGNQAVGRIISFAAVLWDIDKWTYTSLGSGFAVDTNGVHQVGHRGGLGESRAIRWSGTEASALDLHQFLPANIVESSARGIDENGNIVGWGHINSFGPVPILWKPVPEQATAIMLGAGLLMLAARRRSRR